MVAKKEMSLKRTFGNEGRRKWSIYRGGKSIEVNKSCISSKN